MKRLQIAQIIALVASVVSIVGWILNFKNIQFGTGMIAVGIVLGIVSYLFGGLVNAFKMAFGIAKLGWVVAPFPICIATGGVTLIFALMALVCVPIIPVRKTYLESME